ncbi:Ras-related protein Rab-33B [Clonorchis sinensis]|uniref:Ras-related protein Rab-33B n=1 Tax=Clonorchis sinensis TaxID=79923 RepID=G7YAQ4_CLOSI|nr:Ras-related protein Rab-33B [Clonorchis sinensis]
MPKLVTEFESMIQQASKEIDDMQKSMHQLECKLESNTTAYHQSLDQAYSELESKIRQAEEMSKARANRKTEQLRQTQAQETEQIEILRKENDKLTEALEEVESSVEESKHTIEDLQTTARVEQAKREKADAFTCKRIQIECEELMRKLDQLRELNRRLRDERDEALNDDRARKLISTNSLMDEVNEVFERQNVCAEEGTEMTAQVLQSGEITSPQDAVVTATEVFSDEDYEFEDSWSQSVDSFKLNKSIYEAERPEGTDQLQKPQQAAVREEVFGCSFTKIKNSDIVVAADGMNAQPSSSTHWICDWTLSLQDKFLLDTTAAQANVSSDARHLASLVLRYMVARNFLTRDHQAAFWLAGHHFDHIFTFRQDIPRKSVNKIRPLYVFRLLGVCDRTVSSPIASLQNVVSPLWFNFVNDEVMRRTLEDLYNPGVQISGQPTELGRGLRMFKVVVVGQSGSGRTALVSRICGDKEIDKAEEVREEIELRVCSLEVDGERVVIQFWDIQGDDKYFPVNQYICEKADGVIFVYAGCSMSDFNQLDHRIMKMLKGLKTTKKLWEDTVNVLWANKWDLVNSSPALLPVPRSSAEGLAKHGCTLWKEFSASVARRIIAACNAGHHFELAALSRETYQYMPNDRTAYSGSTVNLVDISPGQEDDCSKENEANVKSTAFTATDN